MKHYYTDQAFILIICVHVNIANVYALAGSAALRIYSVTVPVELFRYQYRKMLPIVEKMLVSVLVSGSVFYALVSHQYSVSCTYLYIHMRAQI